jgi:hypothetical protein
MVVLAFPCQEMAILCGFHFLGHIFTEKTCIAPQSHIHIKLPPFFTAVTHTERENVIFVFVPPIV